MKYVIQMNHLQHVDDTIFSRGIGEYCKGGVHVVDMARITRWLEEVM